MSFPRTSGRLCLLLAVILGLLAQIKPSCCADDKTFPKLWESLYAENTSSYHVLYQLEMEHSDELLTVEEWANYADRLYRIDLISADQLRTSYLLKGNTDEVFRFKPYTCDQLGADSADFEVLSKLFVGYPWSSSDRASGSSSKSKPITAYGLGPLWLRATESSGSVEYVQKSSDQADEDHEFGDQFDEFRVELKPNLAKNQVPHKLRFFFPRGERNFVDTIDWLLPADDEAAAATAAAATAIDSGSMKVVAQLRVLLLDYKEPEARLFKLPLGYGCQRRADLDSDLNIEAGLMLLHQGLPSQVVFDVTFSLAQDELMHSWVSQRYSMRMTRLSRPRHDDATKTESFFSTSVQTRLPHDRNRLRRVKRVWWAPNSSAGESTVYEIDQETGACEIGHRDVRDQLVLGYLNSAELIGSGKEKLTVLSVDQIAFLFADNAGYHLIDEGETLSQKTFRDRYYEKRLTNFKLTTDGALTWQGPVSIVKRISSYRERESGVKRGGERDQSEFSGGNKKLSLLTDFQTTLTILFYSQNFDQLQYKVVVQLLGNNEVSYGYAYEQLDISACFESSDESSDESTGDESKELITIKYPLNSPRLARQLEDKRETIVSALYVSLFDHPASFLSPLQLNDIQLSFDLFYMHVQFTIYEVPLNQLFQRHSKLKLEPRDAGSYEARNALLDTTSSSAALCAQHCEHYNCLRFAYDASKKLCQVQLVPAQVKTANCDTCKLFTYVERRAVTARQSEGERPHFSPAALIEYFEELVEAPTGEAEGQQQQRPEGWTNPLEFMVTVGDPDASSTVTLRPSSLRHELESMNEYERELNEEAAAAAGANETSGERRQAIVRQLGGRQLKLQFKRLYENRVLKTITGEERDQASTFEECEQFCQLHDCRTFSYCERDESCQVAWVHSEDYMRAVTVESSLGRKCNVYTLDYMSKFEPFGRVPAPVEAKSAVQTSTVQACASHCMDQAAFACQGFYHCLLPASTNSHLTSDTHMCYLVDKHLSSLSSRERENAFGIFGATGGSSNSANQLAPATSSKICSFYSRSYLAQFDKYFGKRLELERTERAGNSLVIHSSSDVEDCAKRCVEQNCLAFDSCPVQLEAAVNVKQRRRRSVGRQACKLLFNGVKRSQLQPERRCTTFVLSDRSHFNSKKIALLQDDDGAGSSLKPNQEANLAEGNQSSRIVLDEQLAKALDSDPELRLMRDLYERESVQVWHPSSGHWLSRLFSLALGTTFGCVLIFTWNEAYARGWIDRARQQLFQR